MDGDGARHTACTIPHEINDRAGSSNGFERDFKTAGIRQISTKDLRQISPQATAQDPEQKRLRQEMAIEGIDYLGVAYEIF